TDDAGKFVLVGLPAGPVHLSAHGSATADPAHGVEARTDAASPYPQAFVDVELAEGEERSLLVTLPRVKGTEAEPRSIQVRVSVREGADGTAVGSATVVALLRIDDAWIP